MARFYLRREPDPRPLLVVQTCDRADEAAVEAFRRLLYGMACPDGLLLDSQACHVIHDGYASTGPESLEVAATIPTAKVLSKLERPATPKASSLDRRVGLWLERLTSSWEDAIPDDPELAAVFLDDVVPAAVQAVIELEHDAEDAA